MSQISGNPFDYDCAGDPDFLEKFEKLTSCFGLSTASLYRLISFVFRNFGVTESGSTLSSSSSKDTGELVRLICSGGDPLITAGAPIEFSDGRLGSGVGVWDRSSVFAASIKAAA